MKACNERRDLACPNAFFFIPIKTKQPAFPLGNCHSYTPSSAIWAVNHEAFSTLIIETRLNSYDYQFEHEACPPEDGK